VSAPGNVQGNTQGNTQGNAQVNAQEKDAELTDVAAPVEVAPPYLVSVAGSTVASVSESTGSAAWATLFETRSEQLAALDVRYVHLHLPSRSQMEAELHQNSVPTHANVVDATAMLRKQNSIRAQLDPVEDEGTAEACHSAAELVCNALAVGLHTGLLSYPRRNTQCPSGVRARYVFDRRSVLRFSNVHGKSLLTTMSPALPTENARVYFHNKARDAVRQTILVFGEPMPELSRSLFGGILAETFRDVHLVATAAVDMSLVTRLQPDVVLTISRGQLSEIPVSDEAGRIAAAEAEVEAAYGSAQSAERDNPPAVKRSVLLPSETYDLPAPITVQPGCVNDVADTHITTRPAQLLSVDQARVYFDGGRIHIADATGEVVLKSGFGADEQPPVASDVPLWKPWAGDRTLSGTSFLLGASSGAHCYYHWMLELLPRLGLLQRAGIELSSIDHFLVRKITGKWQMETLSRLGIDRRQIVETGKRPFAQCDRVLHVDHSCGINLKMHRVVPLWMKHLFPLGNVPSKASRLYIGRPEGVRRGVANEAELDGVLKKHGVKRVVMEGLSVAKQAELLSGANLVIAPHGGALTNMVFCRPGADVVELLSRHVYPYYYGLAVCCGHRYSALLENPEEDYSRLINHDIAQSMSSAARQRLTNRESFAVDPVLLDQLLEKLGRR
jgi:hypothetical protein